MHLTSVVPVDDGAAWDAFVHAHPAGDVCHLWHWRGILADALGHETVCLAALDAEGRWRGCLPVSRVRSRLFGHYVVSMPFLNGGGPLGDTEVASRLVTHAVAEARRARADVLELRGPSPAGVVAPCARKITVRLPLAADAAAQWEAFPAKLRSQCGRGRRAGLTVRFGGSELDAFYDIFRRTMRDLGTPVLPRRWFALIAQRLASHAECGVVYDGDEPVAAGFGLRWRSRFEITWAGSRRDRAREAPNMLLYWSFIERAIALGLSEFDFGRCTPGSGTHRFKQQWGGVDVPLAWGTWARRARQAPPSPHEPLFRLATACWRHLPLAVTNRLGPPLAIQLP